MSCCSSCSGRATRSSTPSSSLWWAGNASWRSPRSSRTWTTPRRAWPRGGGARVGPGAGGVLAGGGGRSRHIRVALRRLDGLMDLIGELVTARGRLNQLAAERRDPAIDDLAIQVSRLSSDLQAEIIQARMTPVWQVFDRFPRLVRDLARELGKQVAFRVEGKEIELDRAILDELGDPLMHLLRNAVDHGIEPASERRRRGKQPEGEVVLSAARERASVAITVTDDGRARAPR